jgi:hypothetical protein
MCSLQKCRGYLRTLILLSCYIYIVSCGGGGQSGNANEQPALELSELLQSEFTRLGIAPDKVVAKAPNGQSNYVFDLTAEPHDSHSEDELPADSIRLSWTERMQGDYDGNGLVNISDLTPLGQRLGQSFQYDPPANHSGLAHWPAGDAETDPAGNWKLARVDGDGNALITTADITTIAIHWNESLSAYRVYRRQMGQEYWKLLPHATDISLPYSQARPNANEAGLYRYSYTDQPPLAGDYEYKVLAYDAGGNNRSASESQQSSNIATASFGHDLTDNLPPVWDFSTGITGVYPRAEGNVLVTFSSARDDAPHGVAPSDPVTYDMYWSLESPLDFSNASRVQNVQNPWFSPVLLPETTYYFAVRASDSAVPPNVDDNTVELPVTTVASELVNPEDTDPPVWITPNPSNPEWVVKGIVSIEPLDGSLRITRADAMDELSPPVHYDLYFLPRSYATGLFSTNKPEDADKYEMNPGVQVIREIPKVLELPGQNRENISMVVWARDSSVNANEARHKTASARAPEKELKIELDNGIPGVPPESDRVLTEAVYDWHREHIYFAYCASSNIRALDRQQVWLIDMDARSGDWEARMLYETPEDFRAAVEALAVSPTGEVWVQHTYSPYAFKHVIGFSVRRNNGAWEYWDVPNPPGWRNQTFDHNGNPAWIYTTSGEPSDVQENRYKLFYRWWDATAQEWIDELAVDPGGRENYTFLKPDGTIQLLASGETVPPPASFGDPGFNDGIPYKFRIAERSVDGVWTTVMEEVGSISSTYPSGFAAWDEQIAWSGSASIDGQSYKLLFGGDEYQLIPAPEPVLLDGNNVYGLAWPGPGDLHYLPSYVWQDGELRYQILGSGNMISGLYIGSYGYTALDHISRFEGAFYNPLNGDYAVIDLEPDMQSGEIQWIMRKPQPGSSLLEIPGL